MTSKPDIFTCALQLGQDGGFEPLVEHIGRALESRDVASIDYSTKRDFGGSGVVAHVLEAFAIGFAKRGELGALQLLGERFDMGFGVRDVEDRSLRSVAAWMEHKDIVEYCLARDLSLDDEDLHGRTPLYWAARGGNQGIVSLLVNHDARITPYAIDTGRNLGHDTISEFLREVSQNQEKTEPA